MPRFNRLLITGAAGNLGRELRRGLAPLATTLRLTDRDDIGALADNEEAMACELGDFDAVMQDIQFHPVSDSIIHIDFVQVFPDKKVTVNLPVELTGSSVGIREGGKLRQRRRNLKVNGLIKDMPDRLEIDLSDLDIGDSMKVGDLSYDNLEVLDPPRAMIAGVVSSRLIAKGLREAVPEEGEEVEEEALEEGETPATDEAPAAEEEGSSQEK